MTIEFDTTDFAFAHGRQPRGRGSWCFSTTRRIDVTNDATTFWAAGGSTFSEAKQAARAWVKAQPSARTIFVGS